MFTNLKRTTAVPLAALILSAVAPLATPAVAAPATSHGEGRGAPYTFGVAVSTPYYYGGGYCDPYYGCGYGYAPGYGYSYYPLAPNSGYVPQGGNSGGANFPHSGT